MKVNVLLQTNGKEEYESVLFVSLLFLSVSNLYRILNIFYPGIYKIGIVFIVDSCIHQMHGNLYSIAERSEYIIEPLTICQRKGIPRKFGTSYLILYGFSGNDAGSRMRNCSPIWRCSRFAASFDSCCFASKSLYVA